VAIFLAFALPLLLAVLYFATGTPTAEDPKLQRLWDALAGRHSQSDTRSCCCFSARHSRLHIMGLIDDRKALGPFVKLIAQLGSPARWSSRSRICAS
jgi:hypothetical protein